MKSLSYFSVWAAFGAMVGRIRYRASARSAALLLAFVVLGLATSGRAANGITWHSINLPPTGFAGQTITFTASVTNSGDVPWDASYYLELADAGGTHLNYPSVNGIGVGQTSPVSPAVTFTLTLPSTPGAYTYFFKAMQNGVEYFGESQSRPITVGAPPTLPFSVLTLDTTVIASGNTALATSTAGVAGETIYHGLEGRPKDSPTWENWMVWDGTGGLTQTAPVGPAIPGDYEVRAYAARANQAGFYSNVVTLTVTTNTAITTPHTVSDANFTLGGGTAIRSTAQPAGQIVYHGIEISRNGGAWQNWGVWNDTGGLEQTKYRTPTTSGSYVLRAYAARANMASTYSTPSTITVATTGPLVLGNLLQHFGQIESTEDQDEGGGNGNYSSSTDSFTFYLTGPGTLHVYTSGETDTRGGVSNTTNYSVDVSADDGSGFGGGNFGVTVQNAGAGTYVAWVTGQEGTTSGAYTLNVDFKPDDQTLALPTTVLAAPVALAATVSTAAPTSSFIANWNGVPGVATFALDVATDDQFTTSSILPTWNNRNVSNTLSFLVTGLTSGQNYFYRVRAINTIGLASLSSNAVSAAPQAAPPAAPPLLTPISITNSGFTARWTAVSGVSGYVIDVSRRSDFATLVGGWAGVSIAGAATTSLAVTGLSSATVYYYRLRSVNAVGVSANSSGGPVTTGGVPGYGGPAPIAGTGLRMEYFNGISLTGTPASIGTVGQIDLYSEDEGGEDQYSMRYTGFVRPDVTGSYRFITQSDDGVNLWINGNGNNIISNWTQHGQSEDRSAPVALVAGQLYELKLEYFNSGGGAVLRLEWGVNWEGDDGPREVISSGNFYPPGTLPLPAVTGLLSGAGTYGTAFNHRLTATNAPTSFSASPLPDGLTLNPTTGVISGTPTKTGEWLVTVRGANATGSGLPATLVLNIGKATPILTLKNEEVANLAFLPITPAMIPANAVAPAPGLPAPTGTIRYTAYRVDIPSQTFNPLYPSFPAMPNSFYYGIDQNYGKLSVTATYSGDGNYLPATKTVTFENRDTAPPVFTTGTGLTLLLVAPTSASLRWNAAEDPRGVTYEISVDNGVSTYASGLTRPETVLKNLVANSTYQVVVKAWDLRGNPTEWSAPLTVTTPPAPPVLAATPGWHDVDGDGLLDEIIPQNTSTFTAFTLPEEPRDFTRSEWEMELISVGGFYYNFGTETRYVTFTAFRAGQATDYRVTLERDYIVYVPPVFIEDWTENIQTIRLDQVSPVFQFVAQPGYSYSINREITISDGTPRKVYPALVEPTLWELLGSLATVHEIPYGAMLESSYDAFPTVLVRRSLAPAGAVLTLPDLGAVMANKTAGTITLPDGTKVSAGSNGATVNFPGGGSITINTNGTLSGSLPAGVTHTSGVASVGLPGGITVSPGTGEVTIAGPAGSSVTVGGPGGLRVALPPGLTSIAGVIGKAVDMVGTILGGGTDPTKTKVENGDGTGTWRDPNDPALGDVAGTGTQTIQVGATDADNRAPTQANIFTITFTRAQPPVPRIQFIRGETVLSFARVGHWGADHSDGIGLDGFDPSFPFLLLNDAAPANFVDKDPERFFLRVFDPARNANSATRERITVRVGSLDSSAAVDAPLIDVTLEETGNNTGVFVSESQLLVGPDAGDVPDSALGVFSQYNTAAQRALSMAVRPDRRTHRVTVDGSVKAEYHKGSATYGATIPVCSRSPDERKVLNVVVWNFYEPWQDLNNNRVRDVGEPFVDVSQGATVFSSSGTWGPIWTDVQIDKQMAGLRAAMAAARIRVVEVRRNLVKPSGELFAQSGTPINASEILIGRFDDQTDATIQENTLSRDHVIIKDSFRSPEQTTTTDTDDVVDIYFVPPLVSLANGLAIHPERTWMLNSYYPATTINQVFVGLTSAADNKPMVLAHEIFHELTNSPDATPTLRPYLLFQGSGTSPGQGSTPEGRRRIREDTTLDARATRPADSLYSGGNRLLRTP